MSLLPPTFQTAHDAVRRAPQHGLASERAAALYVQPPRRLNSNELLDGEREIEIEHAGAVYRLRRTSLGKLILTK